MLGMILQRFELIDHTSYQLKIKADPHHQAGRLPHQGPAAHRPLGGDRYAARATHGRPAKSRTRQPSRPRRCRAAPRSWSSSGPTWARPRSIARQIADDGRTQRLRDHRRPARRVRGQAAERRGRGIIASSSYNGTPARQRGPFLRLAARRLPGADALAGVSYTVFGCGNRDWAATYQACPS